MIRWLTLLIVIRIILTFALFALYPESGVLESSLRVVGEGEDDEEAYFLLAQSLAVMKPIPSLRNLGFPLVIVPFLWVHGANNFESTTVSLVIFDAVLLASLSIILVALIAERLCRKRQVALLATTLWTLLPLGIYLLPLFDPRHSYFQSINQRLIMHFWAKAIADPLSNTLVLLAMYLLLRARDEQGQRWAFLNGLTVGLATMVFPSNVVFVPLSFLLFAWKKRWMALGLSMMGFAIGLAPQLVYNRAFFDSWINLESLAREEMKASELGLSVFSFQNIVFNLQRAMHQFPAPLLVLTIVALLVTCLSLWLLFHRNREAAMILGGWMVVYLAFYGSFHYFSWMFLRYLMPIYPAVLMTWCYAAYELLQMRQRMYP